MTTDEAAVSVIPEEAHKFLVDAGLAEAHEPQTWEALTGGVSSELWHVETTRHSLCVKGALARLNVAGEWHAPLGRNQVEWDWLRFAHRTVPGAVPVPLAHDADRGLFAMSYLPPVSHALWKAELLSGRVDPAAAAAVGSLIGRLHAASADDSELAHEFATDDNFRQLRVDPYMTSTARRHEDLAAAIRATAERTMSTRRVLIHGDVSPKNILLGDSGPVLLDAECAWFGDPAFDVAFVLAHLMLKTMVVSHKVDELLASAALLVASYMKHVTWESHRALSARVAQLLPLLLLARIDGLSPVEYLDDHQRDGVRSAARRGVAADHDDLEQVLARTSTEFELANRRSTDC
ncbi:phosphotransferase [Rhodococcus sp. BP-149]|uniref:phosphotransferase n=1 Tax=unclassified Rhodococcus (in: high G+C Gram-positive bacteria) TaxID=192944 RepID=UPI001C9B8F8B|nr:MULTISPECIES: phosphotransferase [unclassified Rhodococcus (in: high G+C Gram-positive bacteria)]MBY6687751.1 phosphotransferase [Rhodococcus sp. BP-288]MBY6696016.1 phosphotransferase [Rhodococcus sp. BP-188]MBY6700613.1 phosphotransferase [Rhodococcus sp. BP-285]MBY6705010.1 phosphotransferase [Rhodococcus sp. BP-283]MBY6708576.1 phosphotransferase [Rhodococcus sp. BP-241]